MVQIIQEKGKKPTFAQKLAGGMEKALPMLAQMQGDLKQKEMMQQEKQNIGQFLQSQYGIEDASQLPLDFQKEILKGGINQQSLDFKNKVTPEQMAQDKKRRDSIEKHFGPEAAEIYESAPEGGKTEIIKHLLENSQRGRKFTESLGNQEKETPSEIKTIDYDKGTTPAERVRRQENRYNKNLPLYQESEHKTQALEHAKDSLDILEELSPHIGGWDRLNINPTTGSLLIPAAASPEAQRFVKTVNDFTVNAKDSFGARVSNFELDRFMQRLPTLANSIEGRGEIIKQMKIINDMNLLREKGLQDVIQAHGGIRNIDYDQAERLSEKENKPRLDELKKEYKKIDSSLDKQYDQVIERKKKDMVAPGRVMVEKGGKQFSLPKKQLKKAIEQGYKAL